MTDAAALNIDRPGGPSTSKLAFARHFGEMVAVMFAGMGVFAGLGALALSAAGMRFDDLSGGLRVTLMGVSMTAPMVGWMAYRGHGAARNAEMAAAMMVPTMLAAALTWAGTIGTGAGLAIQHAVMVPAMLGVMLWSYAEYAHPHPGKNRG